MIGLASEVDKLHTKRLERAEAERAAQEVAAAREREWLRGAQDELRFWPAPQMDETPVAALGVKPELGRAAGLSGSGEAGPYVPRAIDEKAALRLRERGFVLLVGEPASGVTRTAAELAQTAGSTRRVLAPRPPHGLRRSVNELNVLDRLQPPVRLVLWLDRISDYLPDGVTVPLLQRCQEASPRLRIVATIGSTRYLRWQTEQPELAAWFGDPVHLKRLPTPRERDAADDLYPDRDFTHGVAAAFTGTRLSRVS